MDCAIFELIGSDRWRDHPSVRDVTDVLTLVFIEAAERQGKNTNLTSISEFLGISRATATRRIRYLIDSDLLASKRDANSALITLTKAGYDFVQSISGERACSTVPKAPHVKPMVAARQATQPAQPVAVLDAEALFDHLSDFQRFLGMHTAWLVDWYHSLLRRIPLTQEDCGTEVLHELDHKFGGLVDISKMIADHQAIHNFTDQWSAHMTESTNIDSGELEELIDLVMTFNASTQAVERDIWHIVATVDPLTGLGNRHFMLPQLRAEQVRAQRQNQPCTLVIADLDRFKRINDQFGHSLGDKVLRQVADVLRQTTRPYDLIFRYGGEEFLICLPGTDSTVASHVLSRVKAQLQKIDIFNDGSFVPNVTCTFGVAEMRDGETVEQCMEHADAELYRGKRQGRNRISIRA